MKFEWDENKNRERRTYKRLNIMRNIEQRAEFDEFTLTEHYDFSGAIRGRYPRYQVQLGNACREALLHYVKFAKRSL